MLTLTATKKLFILAAAGFQGFQPLTATQKTKAAAAFPDVDPGDWDDAQIAKFVTASTVQDTDDDAGDGNPITFDKVSYSTQSLLASEVNVPVIVDQIRNQLDNGGTTIDIWTSYNKGFNIAVEDVPPVS